MIPPMRPHPIYQSPGIMLGLDFLWLTKKLQVSRLVQVVVNLINQRNKFLLSIIISFLVLRVSRDDLSQL